MRYNLQSVRTYILKEDFDQFWEYVSPAWAGKFLDQWCNQAMRSRIEPLKKVVKMLRAHRPLIVNYFRAKKRTSETVWATARTTHTPCAANGLPPFLTLHDALREQDRRWIVKAHRPPGRHQTGEEHTKTPTRRAVVRRTN